MMSTNPLHSRSDEGDALLAPDVFVFDLDQTLVDSTCALALRKVRAWSQVYPLIPRFRLYSGIQQLLELISGFPIAVVTNSPRPYAERVLAHFRINVDAIVCYHDTKLHKPNPEPISLAIDRLRTSDKWKSMGERLARDAIGSRKPCIWGIGDHPHDIRAAKAASIVPIGAAWGSDDAASLQAEHPATIFKVVEEMYRQIDAGL